MSERKQTRDDAFRDVIQMTMGTLAGDCTPEYLESLTHYLHVYLERVAKRYGEVSRI